LARVRARSLAVVLRNLDWRPLVILNHAFGITSWPDWKTPALTISVAMTVLGVTHRWASQTIEKLIEAEILREVPGQGRPRLFTAPEVLRAIEGL